MFKWLLRRLELDLRTGLGLGTLEQKVEKQPELPYISKLVVKKTNAQLPDSLTIRGVFSRYHDLRTSPPDSPLWRSFLDDDMKWRTQGRFAGSMINCGHFFSLSAQGASAEAAHYEVDLKTVRRLDIYVEFEKILDLSSISAMQTAFSTITDLKTGCASYIAEQLIEEDTGGTILTDRMGYWAGEIGYNGILFFSSRVLWGPEVRKKEKSRPPLPWNEILFPLEIDALRNAETLNIVLFRGLYVVSKIKKYRIEGGTWIENEFFNKTEKEIDEALQENLDYKNYDLKYQEEKARFHWTGKIKYTEK